MRFDNPFARKPMRQRAPARSGPKRHYQDGEYDRHTGHRKPVTLPRVRFLEKPFDPTEVWLKGDKSWRH